jgi:hypothetical protein
MLIPSTTRSEPAGFAACPELLDVQMSPATPTRCVPVESDATASQACPEADVPMVLLTHVEPELVDVQMSPPSKG